MSEPMLTPEDFTPNDYIETVWFPQNRVVVFKVLASRNDAVLAYSPEKEIGYTVFERGPDFRWINKVEQKDVVYRQPRFWGKVWIKITSLLSGS